MLIDKGICPICGKDNQCQNSVDCWCYNVTIPEGLLRLVPEEKRGQSCICKACIDRYNSREERTLDGPQII